MSTPKEKLAESLQVLKEFQGQDGVAIIKTNTISRTHRDRLLKNGFIKEVMKGWYISSNPGERKGDSTSWYSAFWKFCGIYLNDRFNKDWCVSAEQSISIHSGNWTIPKQLLIRSSKGGNNLTSLVYETSIFDLNGVIPTNKEIIEKNGIRIFSLSSALISCTQNYFLLNPTDVRTALATIKDDSKILALLLDGGNSKVAGRLAGALRNIGRISMADNIVNTMKSAGYEIRENDPFKNQFPLVITNREVSPYVDRIKVMWQQMREPVLKYFPKPMGIPKDKISYLKRVEDFYKTDAYHSLSIEGYKVSTELIERVRFGQWNPEGNEKDKSQIDALAARGYYLAFEAVKKSIDKVISGQNPGKVADEDHGEWYRQMFSPSILAGLLKPSDLAGYRNSQVFISQSSHIPLNVQGVRDAMPTLFEMIQNEHEPGVRAVLGHFIFVYIHPYMDGNGRIGRFLMNVMLASGGFPWTVIPLEKRHDYMNALEKASVEQNIDYFAKLISNLVSARMKE